jgi:hypothetical protein
VKTCIDCAAHELHLATLAKTLDAFERKVSECKDRNHDGRPTLKAKSFSSLCIECLATGFATSKVLSDQILEPVDLHGRRIRDSRSSSTDGGVWPIPMPSAGRAFDPSSGSSAWVWIVAVLAVVGFVAALGVWGEWLIQHGLHF